MQTECGTVRLILRRARLGIAVVAIAGLGAGFSACGGDDDEADQARDEVQQRLDEAEQRAEEAKKEAEQRAGEAKKEAEEAVERARKRAEEAKKEIEEAIDDTGGGGGYQAP